MKAKINISTIRLDPCFDKNARTGYVKLWRSFFDSKLISKLTRERQADVLHIVTLATHKPLNIRCKSCNEDINLVPGDLPYSQNGLAGVLDLTRKQIRTLIDILVDGGFLGATPQGHKKGHRCCTYSVMNWEAYQGNGEMGARGKGQGSGPTDQEYLFNKNILAKASSSLSLDTSKSVNTNTKTESHNKTTLASKALKQVNFTHVAACRDLCEVIRAADPSHAVGTPSGYNQHKYRWMGSLARYEKDHGSCDRIIQAIRKIEQQAANGDEFWVNRIKSMAQLIQKSEIILSQGNGQSAAKEQPKDDPAWDTKVLKQMLQMKAEGSWTAENERLDGDRFRELMAKREASHA